MAKEDEVTFDETRGATFWLIPRFFLLSFFDVSQCTIVPDSGSRVLIRQPPYLKSVRYVVVRRWLLAPS